MSSGFNRGGFLHSLGFRISSWYACSFLAGFVLIGFFTLWIIRDSGLRLDREEIMQEFSQDAERCRQIGSSQFRVEMEHEQSDLETTLIRLAEPGGKTAALSPAFGASRAELHWIERELQGDRTPGWRLVPIPKGRGFWQVYAGTMPDDYTLQVAKKDRRVQDLRARLRAVLLPLALFTLFLALSGAALLTGRALRPLHRLIEITRTVIQSGDMTARVPVRMKAGHELDELNQLFNRMLAKNEALIRGMREALDNVAHDLRTPLTRMRVAAEDALLAPDAEPGVKNEALADAIEESERALAMLRTLMDISEAEYGTMRLSPEPLEIKPMLEQVVELYSQVAEEAAVRLHLEAPESLRLVADRTRLEQVLCNLLDNAIKYSQPGGEVTLEARQAEGEPPAVRFTVRDRGIGISAQDLPRVWDRLFRADRSRGQRGIGLGLCLVKAIVQAHAGRIEVESVLGEGSVFRFFLPAGPKPG